jgi:hypothetical protein
MNLRETGCKGGDWIELAQNSVQCEDCNEATGSFKPVDLLIHLRTVIFEARSYTIELVTSLKSLHAEYHQSVRGFMPSVLVEANTNVK